MDTEEPKQTGTSSPRILVGAAEAAALCGISRSSLFRGDRTGEIGPRSFKIGRRRLWSVEELAAWARHGCEPRSRWIEHWRVLQKAQ